MTSAGDIPRAPGILLLGPLEVRAGTRTAALGGRQARALFTLLALQPGVWLPMASLVRELWDGEPPRGATNTVQVYVSRLRRALPASLRLRAHQNGYLLDAPPDATDVHRFERLASAGHEALAREGPAAASACWHDALRLWRGPALQDLTGPAGQARRAGLEAQRMRTIADRMDADALLGRHEAIIPELHELAREHPLDERTAGQLMRALYVTGHQADALGVYRVTARRLADELGVDPGPALRQIHAEVLRQDPGLRPARRVVVLPEQIGERSAPSTGPAASARPVARMTRPPTPLVGRRDELAQARYLLAQRQVRLLTIVGPGGVGKTRLALELTGRADDDAHIPVVPLESAADPADLLPRICQTLGAVPSWPGQPLAEVIGQALAPGRQVLVLDHLEALAQAGGGQHLADLLDAVPELTLVATSRSPLRLRGEYLLTLPPLARPTPDQDHDPGQVAASEAGRLFTERAQAVMPDFAVTADNCASVAAVCRMLDGLPLAIELAAARIRMLTLDEMLHRVGARLELLTGGANDLPERQRTMRAVLESSVHLLAAPQAELFARLSVFHGGWTLTDAERVLGGPDLLDGVERLVNRSLVVADGSGRFDMLGVVRAYAAELLDALDPAGDGGGGGDGGGQAIRRAHAEQFAARLAEVVQDVGQHPDSTSTASSWLTREAANLDAALEFAAGQDDGRLLARLLAGLLDHWFYSGRIQQAERWIQHADGARLDPAERAHLLLSAGNLVLVAGDLDRAEPMLEQAHEAATLAADRALMARALAARSVVSRYRGDVQQALGLVEQALDCVQSMGAAAETWPLTVRLGNERGELLDESGRSELAEPLYETFRSWCRAESEPSNEALAVVNLALLAADRGARDEALGLVEQALTRVSGGGSLPLRGEALFCAGLVQLQLGDAEAAGRQLREAAPLMAAVGQLLTLPDTITLLGVTALDTGHPRTAAQLFGISESWRRPRGLAIAGRRTRALTDAALEQLAVALPDPAERERELARGTLVPYGALSQIPQVTGWERIWRADLTDHTMGSLSPNSMSNGGRSPTGVKP